MAKKMLINADMLLATPRAAEKTPPSVVPPIEEKNYIAAQLPIAQSVEEPTQRVEKKDMKSVQKGLKVGETRATFIVQEEDLEKIKAIAYWDRRNIKDVINTAFAAFIDSYEKKNGKIQPIPEL